MSASLLGTLQKTAQLYFNSNVLVKEGLTVQRLYSECFMWGLMGIVHETKPQNKRGRCASFFYEIDRKLSLSILKVSNHNLTEAIA